MGTFVMIGEFFSYKKVTTEKKRNHYEIIIFFSYEKKKEIKSKFLQSVRVK